MQTYVTSVKVTGWSRPTSPFGFLDSRVDCQVGQRSKSRFRKLWHGIRTLQNLVDRIRSIGRRIKVGYGFQIHIGPTRHGIDSILENGRIGLSLKLRALLGNHQMGLEHLEIIPLQPIYC